MFTRSIVILASSAALAASAATAQSPSSAKKQAPQAATRIELPPVPKPLLPEVFAGWVAAKPADKLTDAAQADPANTPALKEYGFTDGAQSTYKRGQEALTVRLLHFQDASGAFGAYSYYRQNGWPKEEIGSGATSNKNRVLFWLGNTVVDANFSQIGPMSGSDLRELASGIAVPQGNKALAPPIMSNLPTNVPDGQLDPQTTHYALGPAGYAGAGGVLPPDLVAFDRGAETVTANYSMRSGPATLTIINYPTPQMAAAQEGKIRDYIKAGAKAQPAWPKPLQDSDIASIEVKRSGPLVAVVSGDAIPDESHKLLATVHYDADITSLPQPSESDVKKTAQLLLGIASLVIVGAGSAIFLGFFFGGFRALYRVARGKPASSVYDGEFISLNLRE